MNTDVDSAELTRVVAERLAWPSVRLAPVAVQCASPVFRAEAPGHPPAFVKLTDVESAARTRAFLNHVAGENLFPGLLIPERVVFEGRDLLCLDWKNARMVTAECMTDGQLTSFAQACRRLHAVLDSYGGELMPIGEDDPDRHYAVLVAYASRHALSGRLLKSLLNIPARERSYQGHRLSAIHGDLQPKNYGFDGERFATFFDFDGLTRGLPCEDAAYAFTERLRRAELSRRARARVNELFARLMSALPWPREDWLIAVNHARLRIAARRLQKHMNSAWIAWDVLNRDRALGQLAARLATRA